MKFIVVINNSKPQCNLKSIKIYWIFNLKKKTTAGINAVAFFVRVGFFMCFEITFTEQIPNTYAHKHTRTLKHPPEMSLHTIYQ